MIWKPGLLTEPLSFGTPLLGERLAMGHPGRVSREAGSIRREPALEKQARKLAAELSSV